MHYKELKADDNILLDANMTQKTYSHNQLFPLLLQHITMVLLCGMAKCPVVISAHLNSLDQTRWTKCKLAVTLPSRKQVDIWSMCGRCVANAINMVLKFSLCKNENSNNFFYLSLCNSQRDRFILHSTFEKQSISVSDSEDFCILVYPCKRLKLCE